MMSLSVGLAVVGGGFSLGEEFSAVGDSSSFGESGGLQNQL